MDAEKLLKRLVQIKSYSGQEEKLAYFLMDFIKEYRLDAEIQDCNVIIKILNNSSKCLIFNVHMDTVKAGNISLWQYPPFGRNSGVVKNGKLYGLGASDAKASIAAMIFLAKNLRLREPRETSEIKRLNQNPMDIWFTFVTSEEMNGFGTKRFLAWFNKRYKKKYKQVAAILGEPTDLKVVELGHKGSVSIKITTTGDSGHAARPKNIKKHAILSMSDVIATMKKLDWKLKKDFSDDLFGSPTVCLTGINTPKESANKVSPVCWSTWDIRTTPQLHKKIVEVVQSHLPDRAGVEINTISPYGYTQENEKIVKIAKKVIPEAKFAISSASNDLCYFTDSQIPAIVFGPGHKSVIHKENEYVALSNVIKAMKFYYDFISHYQKS